MIAWVIGADNKVAPRTVDGRAHRRPDGVPERRREGRRARGDRRPDAPGAGRDGHHRGAAPSARPHAGLGRAAHERQRLSRPKGAARMRLSELCIRRPVMTTLLMASLLLAGFFGYRQLPIAAIPRIEVPTITVTRAVSRRQPRHHGGLGRGAARAAVRHHRRHHLDHLAQHRGQHPDHAGVRPQPQHRCRRARRAVGDLGGGRAPARGPADAAGLPQGQSGRHARSSSWR